MPPVDAATTDRYGPVIGAAGTTTAVASLSSSYLGPTRGSALASLVAIALGTLLHREGKHPALAFWFFVSGAAAGVFSAAYAPVRAVLVTRYRGDDAWSSGQGFSAEIGGSRISVGVRPAADAQITDAEFTPA